ncbi:MAG: hypothetical protein KC609_25745 [Myxococcales bacterium]|nr:hypothetical protein [Myxococcales bacterium]
MRQPNWLADTGLALILLLTLQLVVFGCSGGSSSTADGSSTADQQNDQSVIADLGVDRVDGSTEELPPADLSLEDSVAPDTADLSGEDQSVVDLTASDTADVEPDELQPSDAGDGVLADQGGTDVELDLVSDIQADGATDIGVDLVNDAQPDVSTDTASPPDTNDADDDGGSQSDGGLDTLVPDQVTCEQDTLRCTNDVLETCDANQWVTAANCSNGCNPKSDPAVCYPPNTWKSVALGPFGAVCAINLDGSLWCWGDNGDGQLGINSTIRSVVPALVGTLDQKWKMVSVGGDHSCGIRDDDSLWCWGNSDDGEAGVASSLVPVNISDGMSWASVSAGDDFTCAIEKTSLALYCWGSDKYGQLGAGATDQTGSTKRKIGSSKWLSVSLGTSHACGIIQDSQNPDRGTLHCWGRNNQRQLGQGADTDDKDAPSPVGSALWWDVKAGSSHNCGRQIDNKMYCWGNGSYGKLGKASPTAAGDPLKVTDNEWTMVTAGSNQSCGLVGTSLYCLGNNTDGELGIGAPGDSVNATPQLITGQWKFVASGSGATCAIRSDDTLQCWGNTFNGQVGNGLLGWVIEPSNLQSWPTFSMLSAGFRATCGLTTGSLLYCFGDNESGQLADDTTLQKREPTKSNDDLWLKISLSQKHGCAIRNDNKGFCWGGNIRGQLGIGVANTTLVTQPSQINPGAPAETWSDLSAGYDFTCGVKSDKSLYCWGYNASGELGLGAPNKGQSFNLPQLVDSGEWRMVSASGSSSFACAIKVVQDEADSGTLYCWGNNFYGQLGTSDTSERLIPTQVQSALWRMVSAGGNLTCGIQKDQKLYCWGSNSVGSVGTGSVQSSISLPAKVNDESWKWVSAGGGHVCAIRSDDTLWCWGNKFDGRLTLDPDTADHQRTPLLIPHPAGKGWIDVVAGGSHTCAVDSDHVAWCWGSVVDGQLGLGISAYVWSPESPTFGK